jgi:hypothetical protein
MRFAGDILQRLHGIGAAAIVGPVAQGRQVLHGQLVYRNIPELWKEAVSWTIDEGLPLTPSNIKKNAEKVISSVETMIEDQVGINFDELGHRIQNREEMMVPIPKAKQSSGSTQESLEAQIEGLLRSGGFDPSLADRPDFPF